MSGPAFSADLRGLRDVDGRFARAADGELADRTAEGMRSLSVMLRDLYRDQAPKGDTGKFAESFTETLVVDGMSVHLEIKSSQPDIRRWLRYGTGVFAEADDTGHRAVGGGPDGEIVPKKGRVLYWQGEPDGENWRAWVKGMLPNKWEDRAAAAAKELAKSEGQRFVVRALTDI